MASVIPRNDARLIWRGRLTENGPPMQIVQTKWGQFLEPAEKAKESQKSSEPSKQGVLFS